MSTKSPTCCGCLVDPNANLDQKTEVIVSPESLTIAEKMVLDNLVQAWNDFVSLENRSDDDNTEFRDAIHRAQQLIALRVARRVDPDIWRQPK